MKSALIIAAIVLVCAGCTVVPAAPSSGHDTAANTTASYNFKGDLNHKGGDSCWYRCM